MLKRYDFSEKMRILQNHSSEIMSPTGLIEQHLLRKKCLPWELETFLLFAVTAEKWKDDRFDNIKDIRKFAQAITVIRNYRHQMIEKKKASGDCAESIIIALSAIEFDIQEYYIYKLYRYNCYFSFKNNEINMPKCFKTNFGYDYLEYFSFVEVLWLFFAGEVADDSDLFWGFLLQKFGHLIAVLSITRDDYIKNLNDITTDISDYLYCVRPSYTYPFILEKQTYYLPLPHLLMRSVTASLLLQLTVDDDELSSSIGKEVLEPYLYDILNDSELFDEVFSEQQYLDGKNQQLTLDVMTRKDDTVVFFDSKMFMPKRGVRIFNEDDYEKDVDRLAKACKQIYLHIHDKFPNLYNPFSNLNNVNLDNVFGLVVVRENAYMNLEIIYKKAAELLGIGENSAEFNWLCLHIGIVSIYDVERYCFSQSDIISAVRANSKTGKLGDHWLFSDLDKNILKDEKVLSFKRDLSASVRKILYEFQEYKDKVEKV